MNCKRKRIGPYYGYYKNKITVSIKEDPVEWKKQWTFFNKERKKALDFKNKDHINEMRRKKRQTPEGKEKLRLQNFEDLFLITENENLKLALGIEKIKITDEDSVKVAKVMVDQDSPYLKSLIINKGTKHDIIKGMTVFSKNYLIGTIIETNSLTSRV